MTQKRISAKERIKNRCRVDENECWIYGPLDAGKDPEWEKKYAYVHYYGKWTPVMRAMYEENEGPVEQGEEVRHIEPGEMMLGMVKSFKCHRRCANPAHLYVKRIEVPAGGKFKNTKDELKNAQYQKLDKTPDATERTKWVEDALRRIGVKNPVVK